MKRRKANIRVKHLQKPCAAPTNQPPARPFASQNPAPHAPNPRKTSKTDPPEALRKARARKPRPEPAECLEELRELGPDGSRKTSRAHSVVAPGSEATGQTWRRWRWDLTKSSQKHGWILQNRPQNMGGSYKIIPKHAWILQNHPKKMGGSYKIIPKTWADLNSGPFRGHGLKHARQPCLSSR